MLRFFQLLGLFVLGIAIAHLVQRVSGHFLAESNFGKKLLEVSLLLGGVAFSLGYLCREQANGLWAAFVLGATANHLTPHYWGTDWQTGSIALLVLLFTVIVFADRAGRKAIATSAPALQGGGPGGGGGGGG